MLLDQAIPVTVVRPEEGRLTLSVIVVNHQGEMIAADTEVTSSELVATDLNELLQRYLAPAIANVRHRVRKRVF